MSISNAFMSIHNVESIQYCKGDKVLVNNMKKEKNTGYGKMVRAVHYK
jgi:hypothetical protein